MSRPGIVDLRDLQHRYMWSPREIERFLPVAGLEVEPQCAWRDFLPPRVLVVIARFDDPEALGVHLPWLRECDRIAIVRDRTGDNDVADTELATYIDEQWQTVLAALDAASTFDWFDGDPSGCREAVEHALWAASDLPDRPRAEPPLVEIELPMSKWLPCTRRATYLTPHELVPTLITFEDGQPVLVDVDGNTVDLAAPRAIELDRADVTLRGRTLAGVREGVRNPYRPIGNDPIHPVSFRGYRMTAAWWYAKDGELGFLSATDHEYPCGPGKKLWGFKDNDPVAVFVTPSADAAALLFEHDVTLINNVPVGWHRAGDVDVARFTADPRRAVFFSYRDHERFGDADLTDEDCREFPATFVLGPSPAARYALDLQLRTFRVTGPNAEPKAQHVGGPDEGYAIFDGDHQLVRRGTGRLLGGWFRYATIEDAGSLWREDIATGERTYLGSALRVVCGDTERDPVVQDAIREGREDVLADLPRIEGERFVVAIPGTRNVIELTESMYRVI